MPILSLTPDMAAARRMAMVWGVHAVLVDDVHDVAEMIDCACRTAQAEGLREAGRRRGGWWRACRSAESGTMNLVAHRPAAAGLG